MHKVKGMKKAQAKERMLFVVGVIVICLLALVFVVRFVSPSLESSREGQAKVLANMIAIYANTLSTMDQGRFEKDLGLKDPLVVEITTENGISKVKVLYDRASGKSYSISILVDIEPMPAKEIQKLTILKDITGKVLVEGQIQDSYYTPGGDVPCIKTPTKDEVIQYVDSAVRNPQVNKYNNVEAALVKAVISAESSGKHCVNGYLNIHRKSGATGLMQLLPSTAKWLNEKFELKLDPKNPEYRPEDNVKLGTVYLSYLLNKFGNDREKAIAAYNCGEGHISSLVSKYGSDWKSKIGEECKITETPSYIVKVNSCYSACNQNVCAIC